MSNKISIRFYNNREVRAVWDDKNSKWRFSALDVIGAIRSENDYTKCRNYWKYLKNKLKKENNQLVSNTTQLRLTAADGKKYLTDALDTRDTQKEQCNFVALRKWWRERNLVRSGDGATE